MSKKITINLVSVIRVISALPILFDPLWGFVAFVIIDYFDAYFLQHFAGMGWNSYQQWDKKFDIPGFLTMVFVGFQSGFGFWFGLFMVYRMIGEILFFKFKKQSVLLFFPNFIEPYYVWVILLGGIYQSSYVLIILFILQVFLEYFLHIYWPNYLRKNDFPIFFRIFGLKKVDNWD